MKMFRFLVLLGCLIAQVEAGAGLASPQTQKAASEIDALLATHWQKAGVTGNAPIGDEAFVRRLYLDLAGRIPTVEETMAFLGDQRAGKRAALIDELLARESYVSHFYNYWADILRFKSTFVNTANVVPAAYAKYLKESLRANKPYDQLVREMLSAKGYVWDNGAIGYYARDPEMPLDNMALTTRIFLGTRIECAQCHNHPFDKWKQTEFYHLAAFTYGNKPVSEALSGVRDAFRAREQAIIDDFNREKAASHDGGQAAAQRKSDRFEAMQFRTVLGIIRNGIGQLLSPIGLDRKQDAILKLPSDFHQEDGKAGDVMTPRPIFGEAAELSPGAERGEVFAHWVTSAENPTFTRVIVNRLWKKMLGVALIEPLDELRDDTQAMVPELEAFLEKLMIAQHYDMRAFLAIIANTRAYQSVASPAEFTRESPWHFQGPALRRMTAEQIWDSLVALASYEPDARDLSREAREERRLAVSHMVCDAYLNYDGKATVDLGYASLASENAIQAREKVAREAEIVAKREGDKARETELRRELGRYQRERQEGYVRNFMMPLLTNLAQKKGGPEAKVFEDETYKMNTNPAVFAVETWRKMYVPGYGQAPKTASELEAEAKAEQERLATLAARLGYSAQEYAGFSAYCQKGRNVWLRASELESPAPRGHFLRTMGQSDRDFVENANPNASIPQALAFLNGDLLTDQALLSRYSPVMHAVQRAGDGAEQVDAAFLALFSRKPTADEKARWLSTGKDVQALIYTLLNTKQFIFIQ